MYIVVAVGIQFFACIIGAIISATYWHLKGCDLGYMNLNANDESNC
jgi:hypothetical protein